MAIPHPLGSFRNRDDRTRCARDGRARSSEAAKGCFAKQAFLHQFPRLTPYLAVISPEVHLGHAGAIVSGSAGTAAAKKEALEAVGVKVGKTPSETADLMREIIAGL